MTSKRPDFYAILEVSPQATQAEIGHAYRSLLRRHHPDTRDPVDESHSDSSDPARRAHYDREVRRRSQPPPRQPPPPLNQHRAYDQPPIVAGPVYWQR